MPSNLVITFSEIVFLPQCVVLEAVLFKSPQALLVTQAHSTHLSKLWPYTGNWAKSRVRHSFKGTTTSHEVNVGHFGGKHERGMDHSYTCSYVFLQTHRNMYVYFVCIHKAVHTCTQDLWVECLVSSPEQSFWLVPCGRLKIWSGHLHWGNWGLIIKQINMLSH